MARFMCIHTVAPGKLTTEQIRQFAQAAENDPIVRGYRSFANLAEGRAICVMEAPSKEALTFWFARMNLPVDSITKVELEGERGHIQTL